MFLKISQNSQKNTFARASFLIKLQAREEFSEITKNAFFTEHLWWLQVSKAPQVSKAAPNHNLNWTCTCCSDNVHGSNGCLLTLSWLRSLSYRNQSTDLLCKSMDWFLYDTDLGHERVKSCVSTGHIFILLYVFSK